MRNLTVRSSWTSQTGNGRSCQRKTDLASQPSHDCTVGLLPFVSELWGQSTIHHCGCPAKSPCCCKNQWCKSTMFNVPHTLFICSAFELFCLSKNLWWPFSALLGMWIKYFDIKVIFGVVLPQNPCAICTWFVLVLLVLYMFVLPQNPCAICN